ncbi:MAG: DUF1211 domain-containing protein [Cyclobacteriaceae bacterium]|nr:DUF1211 domain-containing protein [Cyclobacteriaceae bacterium]
MFRESFKKHYIGLNQEFRFRGEEPGRLENFSDAIFALAITLLLISTSPPTNFEQIKRFTFDLIPFLLCIALIVSIWHEHFTFFYRYGLRNGRIIFLNTLFLIIVLFYVYPLKFLSKLILIPISILIGNEKLKSEFDGIMKSEDIGDLMIIYGIGAASISLVLMMMYRYALKKSDELELNEIERFDTKVSARSNFLMAIIPLVSVVVAFIFRGTWLAGFLGGMTYFLYTPVMSIHGRSTDKKRKKLLLAHATPSIEEPAPSLKE